MDTISHSPTPDVLAGVTIIDADTHITEPHDLFIKRAPAKYKDRVPQVKFINGEGKWVIDGDKVIGTDMGCAAVLRDGSKVGAEFFEKKIHDIHEGAYDVKARLRYMDEAGIQAQIGYGNLFGFAAGNNGLCDSDLRVVSLQIYNDFLAEFQEESGNRVFPMMLMPWWDVKEAVAEVKRCHKMGLRGINTNSDPHLAGMPTLGESYWNPLWETCVDLDLPVNFHIGSSDASQVWYGQGAWPTLKTPAEQLAFGTNMMLMSNLRVVANIIMSGFLETFPTLKVVSVESGVGWLPMMLESLEYQMQQNSLKYKTSPLEMFRRQMYACAWFERRNFAAETRALGVDTVMFETDFPHPTCVYPDALHDVAKVAGEFTAEERRKVFGGTAARVYNIPRLARSMDANYLKTGVAPGMPAPARALSCKTAIVGIGETDYHQDYKASRAKAPGYEAPTVEELVKTSFERALADSGLKREDIDGLTTSYTFGGPSPTETADMLGLKPHFCQENGSLMSGPLPVVCAAIAAGKAETVAMVYSVAQRSQGLQFGGTGFGQMGPDSYYYFHPWGWSSQAAHWAMRASYYSATYGTTEADLGAVAVQVRKNAMAHPQSVMQTPMTIDDYLNSRYVVRPLHLFDLCLVNDGAICLIIQRADKARDLPHTPVLVAGWGGVGVKGDKMHHLVRQGLREQLQEAGNQALDMAGLKISDVQHFEGYDASTIHLISQVEGYGLVEPGAGLDFFKQGHAAVGGKLPINVSGGLLSGSYMHGWSQIVEITRQLRHEAGPRQIKDVRVSMSSVAQTDQAHPIVYVRGA